MLLLTRHPEVQARVYEEIKAVVGTDRIPDMQDRAALPYLDCVIQEFHRFNPAIPLVTHGNSKEDEYLGYRIPKKTWIMANVWCVTPNPFDPVSLVLTSGLSRSTRRGLGQGNAARREGLPGPGDIQT